MNQHELIDELANREKIVCSFCNITLANTKDIVIYYSGNSHTHGITTGASNNFDQIIIDSTILYDQSINAPEDYIIIEYIKCPACGNIGITVYRPFSEETFHISPRVARKNYPDYIPEQIRQDYEEACLIAELSPKASATLARRCLQGMIRDFFKINKRRLVDEIEEAAKASGMSSNQKAALDALRNIGNIGAHPERDINLIVDVEPDEARLMISLIEFFMQQWYIQKHDEEEMMKNITSVAQQKKNLKNPSQPAN